jgi:hypothetical protein
MAVRQRFLLCPEFHLLLRDSRGYFFIFETESKTVDRTILSCLVQRHQLAVSLIDLIQQLFCQGHRLFVVFVGDGMAEIRDGRQHL